MLHERGGDRQGTSAVSRGALSLGRHSDMYQRAGYDSWTRNMVRSHFSIVSNRSKVAKIYEKLLFYR